MKRIVAQPLTAEAFAPYGDVLEARGAPDKMINAGLCGRFHDRASLDFGPGGRAGISIFDAEPRALPYTLDLWSGTRRAARPSCRCTGRTGW